MNGGSFGAISPIDGRYGSVMTGASLLSCWSFGLSYSIHRFTPSRAWPLSWASFFASLVWTLRPHLIVKWVPCSTSVPHRALTGYNLKLWMSFTAVSALSHAFLSPRKRLLPPSCLFSRPFSTCLRLPLHFWLFFACTSLLLLASRSGTEIRLL